MAPSNLKKFYGGVMDENQNNSRRDIWCKIEILTKLFAVLFISGALTFYAIYSENSRAKTNLKVSQESNKWKLYTDALRSRQATDASVKSNLMCNLLERIFMRDNQDDSILSLELLSHNFHDRIDLRAFFRRLDSEMEPDQVQKLRKMAYELKKIQRNRLVGDGARYYKAHLKLGKKESIGEGKVVRLDNVDVNAQLIRVTFIAGLNQVFKFSVGPYDFPLTDYTTIKSERYAFVLHDAISREAFVSLIVYPRYYVEIQDKIRVERLLEDLNKHSHLSRK
jgi:hypothetical protein